MSDRTTASVRSEAFVQQMTDQMSQLARTLSAWVQAEPRCVQDVEAQVVRVLRDLGTVVLTALMSLTAPGGPAPDVPCSCVCSWPGISARAQRR